MALRYPGETIFPDNVKLVEAFGGKGERVFDPEELPAAYARAMQSKVPYLIDVVVEREADCSMGAAIDKVREFV